MSSPRAMMMAAALTYLLVLLINPGFMGTDEYWTGITRYIPAQTQNFSNMMRADDVKSSLQLIPFVSASQLALFLGIESHYAQYRFVQIFWGLINLLVIFGGLWLYRSDSEKKWDGLVFLVYFAGAFAFTRPMFESLSAGFLLFSALSLHGALMTGSRKATFLSTVAISLAFCFRPQAGIAGLGILILFALKKDWKNLKIAGFTGSLLFAALGFSDFYFQEGWHSSLKKILFYNLEFGSTYAVQPWYFYLALSVIVLWVPFFLSPASWKIIKLQAREQRVYWLYAFLVLGLHSFFSQKWERFLIPVLPAMMLILSDWVRAHWDSGFRKRVLLLGALNGLLWFPASLFPAQGNIIGMSLHLNDHPEILTVYRLQKSPEWITEAFIQRKDWSWKDVEKVPQTWECHERWILREQELSQHSLENFEIEARFETNWLEKLAYRFNPSKNQRRAPLIFLRPKDCSPHKR